MIKKTNGKSNKPYPPIIFFIFLFLFCIICFGCGGGGGGGDGDGDPDQNDIDFSITNREYTGTATITIDYYDIDMLGNLTLLFTRNYSQDVMVLTGPLKNVGSVVEDNPFNLNISTDSQGSDGNFGITSALVISDTNIGDVLLQYWTFECNNANITGSLTDNHIAESSALNLFWAWDEIVTGVSGTFPFWMDENSSIQGTINNNAARLTLKSTSTDTTRQFVAEIIADR